LVTFKVASFCIETHQFWKVELYILACSTKRLNLLARWCRKDIFLRYELILFLIFIEFFNHIFYDMFFLGSPRTSIGIQRIRLSRIKKWQHHLYVLFKYIHLKGKKKVYIVNMKRCKLWMHYCKYTNIQCRGFFFFILVPQWKPCIQWRVCLCINKSRGPDWLITLPYNPCTIFILHYDFYHCRLGLNINGFWSVPSLWYVVIAIVKQTYY